MPAKEILDKLKTAREEAVQEIARIDEQIAQLQRERKDLLGSLGGTAKGIKKLTSSNQSCVRRRRKKTDEVVLAIAPTT